MSRLMHMKHSECHMARSKHLMKISCHHNYLPLPSIFIIIKREIGFGVEFRCQFRRWSCANYCHFLILNLFIFKMWRIPSVLWDFLQSLNEMLKFKWNTVYKMLEHGQENRRASITFLSSCPSLPTNFPGSHGITHLVEKWWDDMAFEEN